MTVDYTYDLNVSNQLKARFAEQKLYRPMRIGRYDAGTKLSYEVTSVSGKENALIDLEIKKFVGGGFAGQVYQIEIQDIRTENGPATFPGIKKGNIYAMKIMIPPSGFSLFFRNLVYRIGFQGPFQLQVNPTAARAGAIWQKFIRRGAKLYFNDESAVNDIHGIFVDHALGSTGEFSDWVDGRTWRLEVDDKMDLLKHYLKRKKDVDQSALGSPEYRAKRQFMKRFVQLLHQMGAHEFARQYEWSTCKSQPNALKRKDTENDPTAGLMAVDFRAGLALLPLLPMSPGDIKLIFKGIARGSFVQFDRGNLKKLKTFVEANKKEFADLIPMLEELKSCESHYRNSLPDITHNHFKLLYSKRLWSTIWESMRTGWRVRNMVSEKAQKSLSKSFFKTFLFAILGIIPFLGGFIRKLWARPDWRKHYGNLLTHGRYFKRALKGKAIEKTLAWHRSGRITGNRALKLSGSVGSYFGQIPLSLLPLGLHRMFSSWTYFKERLYFIAVRPIKLYFSAPMREQWLKDMVAEGKKKHILNDEDAGIIHSQLKEPYIQKYLKSLAVHVCTLPVTQIVSVIVSIVYVKLNPQLSSAEATAAVAAILVLFQITPISPGSLVRGLYVVYMMIKDRSFKDYNIAVFLGFFKYIGYLAFPIQMTYRYPELARFMAGHWATEAVHIVPVFGEGGALMEHWVFRLFYNWPLTIRRRMREVSEYRETLKSRYWHIVPYILTGTLYLTAADYHYFKSLKQIPTLSDTWWMALLAAIICGIGITAGAGGAARAKRFLSVVVWGVATGLMYTGAKAYFILQNLTVTGDLLTTAAWNVFFLSVLGTFAAVISELKMNAPRKK